MYNSIHKVRGRHTQSFLHQVLIHVSPFCIMHWQHHYSDMQPKRAVGFTHEKVVVDATVLVSLACFPRYRDETLALFQRARIMTASRIGLDVAMIIDGLRSECNVGEASIRAIESVARDLPMDVREPDSADLESVWRKHQVGAQTGAYVSIAATTRAPIASFSPHMRTAARRVGVALFHPAAVVHQRSRKRVHERLRTVKVVRGPLP